MTTINPDNLTYGTFDADEDQITFETPRDRDDLESIFSDTLKLFLEARCTEFTPEACGFTDSVYGRVWIDEDNTCLIVDSSFSAYYSGMSYVAPEYTRQVGRYTIYSAEDSRAREHINTAKGIDDGEEGED